MKHRIMDQPIKRQFLRRGLVLPALALCTLPSTLFAAGLCDGLSQIECKSIASRNVYALLGNNVIARVYGSKTISQSTVRNIDGNIIGLDFRPSQSPATDANNTAGLYALTDTGKIYTLNLNVSGDVTTTLVSSLTTRFDGGFQSLTDFNPVVDALRVIGSNDQNFAVVNSNGNLNATAQQTAITYAPGDPQAGKDPNLTAGTYNNNLAGAANTIFYALDYATDSLVTIATVTNGSSATGGGQLKTIGRIVDPQGKAINIAPEAGIDIYTDSTIGNAAIISNGRKLYFLNLATVNANLAVGSTQNVVVKPLLTGVDPVVNPLVPPQPGAWMDIASTPNSVRAVSADLAVTREINLANFIVGQPYIFELKVANQGPDSQAGVTLSTQTFPFADPVVSTSQGTCKLDRTFEQFDGSVGISCSLGRLDFGATATVKVTVTRVASGSAGARELVAQFTAVGDGFTFPILSTTDPDTSNNFLTSTVSVAR